MKSEKARKPQYCAVALFLARQGIVLPAAFRTHLSLRISFSCGVALGPAHLCPGISESDVNTKTHLSQGSFPTFDTLYFILQEGGKGAKHHDGFALVLGNDFPRSSNSVKRCIEHTG